MFDYLFAAPDPLTAQADAAIGAFWTPANPPSSPGGWDGNVVNAGLQVWSDAGDATQTITDPLMGVETVTTHAYLPGFWLSVSCNARSPALEASPLLVLGADRDAANAGAAMAQFVVALGPGQSLDRFAGMHVSPLMGGANYVFV